MSLSDSKTQGHLSLRKSMAGSIKTFLGKLPQCMSRIHYLLAPSSSNLLHQAFFKIDQRLTSSALFHTSGQNHGLMEFFDDKKNWGETVVKTGRPWCVEELRIKSNSDLHKLWYVLLKERNMLLTMEHEYKRQSELFPNPERIEKVEESMENIMTVVKERDEAYNMLETGKTGEPEIRYVRNFFGLKYHRRSVEHLLPPFMNKRYSLLHPKYNPKLRKYIALYYEKQLINKEKFEKREKIRRMKLLEEFPHLEGKL